MREKKNYLYVDSEERKLLLHSLVGLKNQLIQQGRYPCRGSHRRGKEHFCLRQRRQGSRSLRAVRKGGGRAWRETEKAKSS